MPVNADTIFDTWVVSSPPGKEAIMQLVVEHQAAMRRIEELERQLLMGDRAQDTLWKWLAVACEERDEAREWAGRMMRERDEWSELALEELLTRVLSEAGIMGQEEEDVE